ncbi:MAG: flagellin lysine-N-methylase [Oscillospiraceae bacterium]|nr:flagellin lysine-N-methylase [Oscillospiraceae bacterium]
MNKINKINKIKVYQPEYYKYFECSGSECSLSCCSQNWHILIDKATYDKYVSHSGGDRDKILEAIKVISDDPFKAVILKDKSGDCRMLNESKLCSLQLKYGHDFLSKTCRTYPRKAYLIAGDTERFFELSCEVVVNKALFNKNIMKFEEVIIETDGPMEYSARLEPEKYIPAPVSSPDGFSLFWKLRTASIAIIQNRQYKIKIRMLILCLFIQEIDQLLQSGQIGGAARLADDYVRRIDTGYFDDLSRQMPDGFAKDTDVTLSILKEMGQKGDKHFDRYLKECLQGFKINDFDLPPSDGFADDYIKYYNLYFSDREYIFENYITHNILSDGFPFNYKHEGSVVNSFAGLMAKHDLIEFLLVGLCRHRSKFSKKSVIECIVCFSRGYDHDMKGYLSMG